MHKLVLIILIISFGCSEEDLFPSTFGVEIEEQSSWSVKVFWEESVDPQGGGVTYDLILNDQIALTATSLQEYTFTNLDLQSIAYTGKVIATNDTGKRTISEFSFPQFTVKYLGHTAAHFEWKATNIHDRPMVSYDVYVNDLLLKQNLTETSYVIKNLPLRELISGSPDMRPSNKLEVVAKNDRGDIKRMISYFRQKSFQVVNLDLVIYNISDNSAYIWGNFFEYGPQQELYLDGVFISNYYCRYYPTPPFPSLSLQPNKTYKVKLVAPGYVGISNEYETIPVTNSIEKGFKTDALPFQKNKIPINVEGISSTSATVSWRYFEYNQPCGTPGNAEEYFDLILNGAVVKRLPNPYPWVTFKPIFTFDGLDLVTQYDLKIVYYGKYQSGTLYNNAEGALSFSTQ